MLGPCAFVCRLTPSGEHNGVDQRKPPSRPHIKKPLNAFMLFMKQGRAAIVAEGLVKGSCTINQILGRKVSSPPAAHHPSRSVPGPRAGWQPSSRPRHKPPSLINWLVFSLRCVGCICHIRGVPPWYKHKDSGAIQAVSTSGHTWNTSRITRTPRPAPHPAQAWSSLVQRNTETRRTHAHFNFLSFNNCLVKYKQYLI